MTEEETTTEQTGTTAADGLPDDFQGRDLIERFKDIPSLAAGYVETKNKLHGMASIPGEDASAEERARFFQQLGAPEAVDGYQLPDGVQDVRATLLKHGVSKGAWDAVVAEIVEAQTEQQKSATDSHAQAAAKLRETLGAGADDVIGAAERFLDQAARGNPGLAERIEQSGLKSDPDVIHLLAQAFEVTGTDVTPHSMGGGALPSKLTPVKAGLELRQIYESEEYNKSKPGTIQYDRLNNRINTLGAFLIDKGHPRGIMDPELKRKMNEHELSE